MTIRVVADTHTLLWYLYDDPRLSAATGAMLDTAHASGDQVAISSIALAEVVYLIDKVGLMQWRSSAFLRRLIEETPPWWKCR